jgi:hypothetical protein
MIALANRTNSFLVVSVLMILALILFGRLVVWAEPGRITVENTRTGPPTVVHIRRSK